MSLRSLSSRVLVSYARAEAYVEKTCAILGRLGYHIVDSDEFVGVDTDEGGAGARDPDARIVDEHRLSELDAADASPIILLTGRGGVSGHSNPRVVGAIKRPAGLHDLYRLTQQVFEDTPRSTPRVPIELPVLCGRDGQDWSGELVSLSENGGLLRCDEVLPLGGCFELRFELPRRGPIALRAEAAYQLVPNTGVVFSGLPPTAREAIGDFVNETILA
jgi:hypothetical protein